MLFGKRTRTAFLHGGIDPTRFQMHVQVKRQLMDRLSLILSEKEITPLASYLSAVVLASIDEVLQPVEHNLWCTSCTFDAGSFRIRMGS